MFLVHISHKCFCCGSSRVAAVDLSPDILSCTECPTSCTQYHSFVIACVQFKLDLLVPKINVTDDSFMPEDMKMPPIPNRNDERDEQMKNPSDEDDSS